MYKFEKMLKVTGEEQMLHFNPFSAWISRPHEERSVMPAMIPSNHWLEAGFLLHSHVEYFYFHAFIIPAYPVALGWAVRGLASSLTLVICW